MSISEAELLIMEVLCWQTLRSADATEQAFQLTKAGARPAALSIASKSGSSMVNTLAFDERQVAFNFERIPAVTAMQYIATIDGKEAVLAGNDIRFEPK